MIEKGTPLLLLRVNDFGQYNFTNEHTECLKKMNSIWMLKAGRHLSEKSVNIIDETKTIILKEQKKSGNRFFIAKVKQIRQGRKTSEMVVPDYYKELESSGLALEGTWIELASMDVLDENILQNLVLIKDEQKVADVVGKTRAPILYCACKVDIDL